MGKLFHVFQIVLSVFSGVHKAEDDIGPGSGPDKKRQALDTALTTAVNIAGVLGVAPPIESIKSTVSMLIEGTVSLLHLFGIFKHSSPKPGATSGQPAA